MNIGVIMKIKTATSMVSIIIVIMVWSTTK